MSIFSDYTQEQIDKLKRLLHASDVHFDLLGITLTLIDGPPLHLPHDAIRAMSTLLSEAESEAIKRTRREMAAKRGPY